MIEKRRRDRINRCLNELGKTVPMALAKQVFWTLDSIFILQCETLLDLYFYVTFAVERLEQFQ